MIFLSMSTRQLRLQDRQKIVQKLASCEGRKIQIVLNDQTVIFATVQKVEDEKIVVSNMRLKKLTIPVKNINEVYLDTLE